MTEIKLKGNAVQTVGELPKKGAAAPDVSSKYNYASSPA